MSKPYVVSADVQLLLDAWASKNGFVLPVQDFFAELRQDLHAFMKRMFSHFEIVTESEMSEGIADLVAKTGLVPISMDGTYFQAGLSIEVSRCVSPNGDDRGLSRKAGSKMLCQQIYQLEKSGIKEAVLVDDVIFSGVCMGRIIKLLKRLGIRVPVVCAGIVIGEGAKKLGDDREVRYVRFYREVIDEVCERDFYPGVPLSGRLVCAEENIGAPYIFPFGRPGEWASIPLEHQLGFSRFCISQTARLFEAVEESSHRPVLCHHLGRQVHGFPYPKERFVDLLTAML